jgi:hypothetical protein
MDLATVLFMMSILTHAAGNSTPPEKVHDARDIAEQIADKAADLHEAAMLVELAWRESAFTANAVSKDHRDLCTFQVRDAPRSVLTDLEQCTDLAIERLRASVKAGPDAPLAVYARGRCNSVVGREFSRWRMREVHMLEDLAEKKFSPT